MKHSKISIISISLLIVLACISTPKKNAPKKSIAESKMMGKKAAIPAEKEPQEEASLFLDDKTAIPFFFEYEKNNPENKVRIETSFGNIDLLLYEDTPYHRANFIYLTKKKYFDQTTFHRVVPGFIIQGGNSDSRKTGKKRREIGRYLLPPDTKKGHRHHRGVISVPSSEIDNPYKLASPYEFFIVQQAPGAYHLDGNYTAFGEVIAGMEVVDKINLQKIDKREAPIHNIFMSIKILE